jgi:hypothetical protein
MAATKTENLVTEWCTQNHIMVEKLDDTIVRHTKTIYTELARCFKGREYARAGGLSEWAWRKAAIRYYEDRAAFTKGCILNFYLCKEQYNRDFTANMMLNQRRHLENDLWGIITTLTDRCDEYYKRLVTEDNYGPVLFDTHSDCDLLTQYLCVARFNELNNNKYHDIMYQMYSALIKNFHMFYDRASLLRYGAGVTEEKEKRKGENDTDSKSKRKALDHLFSSQSRSGPSGQWQAPTVCIRQGWY